MAINENLSALLDDEVASQTEQAIEQLLADEAQQRSWCRHYWVRNTIKTTASEQVVDYQPSFSSQVMQAINQQQDKPTPISRLLSWSLAFKPARKLSYGLAAGIVAAATLFIWPAVTQVQKDKQNQPQLKVAYKASASQPMSESVQHWSVSDPEIEQRLNNYLIDHAGLARNYGVATSTTGLVRNVTYQPRR